MTLRIVFLSLVIMILILLMIGFFLWKNVYEIFFLIINLF